MNSPDDRQQHNRLPPAAGGPGLIARVAATLVAAVIAVAALFLGLFFFALVAGLALIAGAFVWFRLWRLKKQLQRQMAADGDPMRGAARQPDAAAGDVIEGEFIERGDERGPGA